MKRPAASNCFWYAARPGATYKYEKDDFKNIKK